jgi:flagellar motor protein MotB
MKKITLIVLTFFMASFAVLRAAEDPRVKSILGEALKLYGDHQYVRALDLFKQAQALDPANATAEDYIKNTKQRILEWELQGNESAPQAEKQANWDTIAPSSPDTAANSKDIIAARKSLVDRMRNRSSNTDNIVQIEQTSKGVDVTLFHDQLFVPGLTTLRDESLPVLQNVADLIRTGGDKEIMVRCASHADAEQEPSVVYPEFSLPAKNPSQVTEAPLQDLESTRALILFTYLAQKSMGQLPGAVIE